MPFEFTKMHGIGNDFIVINALQDPFALSSGQISALAHRRFGVGFDQALVVEPPGDSGADFTYRIFNADGGEVENCGNGARCFARYVMDKGLTKKKDITVSTACGLMELTVIDESQVLVRMGVPEFDPAKVPFEAEVLENSYELALEDDVLSIGVGLGNPHAVTWVNDVQQVDVERIGPLVETHKRFPERVNAGFAQFVDRAEINLRVFERGVGETLACGTGACAAVVVGISQGKLDREVVVHLAGGDLQVRWSDNNAQIEMIGPSETVFEGRLEL